MSNFTIQWMFAYHSHEKAQHRLKHTLQGKKKHKCLKNSIKKDKNNKKKL